MTNELTVFYEEIRTEADRILSWWRMYAPDPIHGGFAGEIDQHNMPKVDADKGSVLHARILWTFSAAYRKLGHAEDLELARKAFNYLVTHIYDLQLGGVYWALKPNGDISNNRKQIYALAFAIYGLAEYFKITGDHAALDPAIHLYQAIEYHSQDPEFGGYFEAYSNEWGLLDDLRLSEKDRNDPKTMNTHLHLIEAYANLYLVWREPQLKVSIERLLEIFDKKIIQPNHHLALFFDKAWQKTSEAISYGHDIEASWLLHECAHILQDPDLYIYWSAKAIQIANAATEGIQHDGSFIHEYDPEHLHTDAHREWWVSAEGMVGFINAYLLTGDELYLQKVSRLWEFTKSHLLDHESGEWYWGVHADYTKMAEYKMGFWKCPYHNVRACFEIMERIEQIKSK